MTQDIQSINELKSYTEYNVSTPTSVFTIGFQYEYNVDHVNVYVDGVEATAAGYIVQHDSQGTVTLTPAVPSGVVRLSRETNIDTSAHTFSAGAKFTAGNMDENFQQVRHAQQEVRDGFEKLSDDTYEIIDTLQDVGQAAQDAADAAEQAAQTANDAAAQVNDKVSYQDLDNAIVATPHNNFVDRGAAGAHPASAISYGSITQESYNDGLESIAQMIALSNPQDGMRVYVKSYIAGNSVGGGQFVCVQSNTLTEDLGVVFRSSVVGYEDYFWVRINFDVLTPEMCGANGTLQDSTDAIERFLNLCGQGYKGRAVSGKVYKTNKGIAATYSTSVNIDFNGASIKPFFNLVAGGGAHGTIRYSHISGDFVENVTVKIDNLFIDLTEFTPVVSTSAADRQGVRGLIINHPETVSINNYKCEGAFYGSGLMLTRYRYANLENIHLPECGMKINPTQDDTGDYDAAGDAIFLVDIIGHGQTTIKNLYAKGQDGYLGRIGVVTEQFAGRTDSHLVTLENAHFEGYHRVIHQEDGGKSRCVWNGGSAKRFSNLCFNLGGIANKNHFDLNAVDIEVDPPFTFGGTSGIACFQGAGDLYLNDCNIRYLRTVNERGNKFISGGTLLVESGVRVYGIISTKTHTLTNVELISNGGYLQFDSGNRGVTINGGTITGVTGTLTHVIHSVKGLIKIGGNCKMTNASVSGENTEKIGRDKNILSDVEIVYTGATNATLFSGSYGAAFKLNNVNIKSVNAKLTLFGDAYTRYSIGDCEFLNVAVELVNASTGNVNSICKVKGSELYYNDSYGQASPFTLSYGNLIAVLSGNTFFDATTAQNIALPAESATFKYAGAGNVMIKTAGMAVL